jgi:hypothetical protein
MPSYCRLTAAVVVLVLTATPLHAATNCTLPGMKSALAALGEHGARGSEPVLPVDCRERCAQRQSADLMLLAGDIPGPSHLPVISGPDEVASWHAEIFEQLSLLRDEDDPLHYCELTF